VTFEGHFGHFPERRAVSATAEHLGLLAAYLLLCVLYLVNVLLLHVFLYGRLSVLFTTLPFSGFLFTRAVC